MDTVAAVRRTLAVGSLLAATGTGLAQSSSINDPYLWLEQISAPRSLQWVGTENERTLKILEEDPRYAALYADALKIVEATDRIPTPEMIGGQITNIWQDAAHVQGIWRTTSLTSFLSASPAWRTLVDLDALSATDRQKWVWNGATCEPKRERRCLIKLSAGGEDAESIREFDLDDGAFVADGFSLPTGKQHVAWDGPDSLLLSRDWGSGTLTKSGYPFVIKKLARGERLGSAIEVYRGSMDDVSVQPLSYSDGAGNRLTLLFRKNTFFDAETFRLTPDGVVKLPLPPKSEPIGLLAGKLIVRVDQDWRPSNGSVVRGGSLVAVNPTVDAKPAVIFAPRPRQALDAIAITKDHVLAVVYDNVRGRLWDFAPSSRGLWSSKRIPLPDNSSVWLDSSTRFTDQAFVRVTSFTVPSTQWLVDAGTATARKTKTSPPRFDATGLVTEQFEASSKDGTKIPYFVVHRSDAKLDGSTPTLLNAYGGFQRSETPVYQGLLGKLWLEKGGAYVLANIRGGGEFGPSWHEAGLKTRRQVVYDDFAAVGEDLIRRRLTSPRRLGIFGGSNGGLLMGVEMTQRPDLWHAVAIEIPLLDMLRYEHLSAGSSWVGEYGSMSVPAERAFWEKTSPYQALRRDGKYPEPFIWTTTKDDRVGPAQARKFAARMKEYGLPYLYWENTEGGHGAGANLRQAAHQMALEITYFTRKLMDSGETSTVR